ncbi:hypothetical protein PVIIG_05764 [Plasmodium vivax India VII]|uniref:Uncharacterized protein n=1 Tax=Plasmodium vivax India VII TaxID=1077284 RepID=A0A0J9S3K9_PLAVI|nr:hypothetical protein PVIIG_05764 [Plasmodium vivax India VII]
MNLMVYCINRNYFKDLCEKSISRKNNVNQTCSLFSEFTNKYYANFYDENKCFDYPLGTDNYGYYISEDCDLNNIAKTFPKFDSNLQSILENDNIMHFLGQKLILLNQNFVTLDQKLILLTSSLRSSTIFRSKFNR